MLNLLKNLLFVAQIDPRIYELEKEIEFYKIIIFAIILVIVILFLIIILQRVSLSKLRKGVVVNGGGSRPKGPGSAEEETSDTEEKTRIKSAVANTAMVKPKELPDPGLIFKYSLAKEGVEDKLITIGQNEGNIKTYSTEVINDHLSMFIRIINNDREKDIYDLPDKITEEYMVDLRRDGKVLIYYPGLDAYKPMGSRERIYIKSEPDETGDPTFPNLEAKQPIRFRIGDRLNQDDKFVSGFFEFHLFTQEYEVKTKAGIPKVEKNFLVRLYKIYPGYDVANVSSDGLYPMMDPYSSKG